MLDREDGSTDNTLNAVRTQRLPKLSITIGGKKVLHLVDTDAGGNFIHTRYA